MKVCRFHGARRKSSIKRGPDHPQYLHGRETLEARHRRVESMSRLRFLTDLGVSGGFIDQRIPGYTLIDKATRHAEICQKSESAHRLDATVSCFEGLATVEVLRVVGASLDR